MTIYNNRTRSLLLPALLAVLGLIGLSLVGGRVVTRATNSPSGAASLPNLQGEAALLNCVIWQTSV